MRARVGTATIGAPIQLGVCYYVRFVRTGKAHVLWEQECGARHCLATSTPSYKFVIRVCPGHLGTSKCAAILCHRACDDKLKVQLAISLLSGT